MIKYGESKIDKIMFGEQMINKVLYGESLIWEYITAPQYWLKATTLEPNQEIEFRFINSYTTTKITSDENSEIILGFDSEYYNPNKDSTKNMFWNCTGLTSLDLSNFDTTKVTNMTSMFEYSPKLTSLDLSNFDTSNVTSMSKMFADCSSLSHIKCKQAFKDWCITNQDTISLPDAMREGGSGTWEIVS